MVVIVRIEVDDEDLRAIGHAFGKKRATRKEVASAVASHWGCQLMEYHVDLDMHEQAEKVRAEANDPGESPG